MEVDLCRSVRGCGIDAWSIARTVGNDALSGSADFTISGREGRGRLMPNSPVSARRPLAAVRSGGESSRTATGGDAAEKLRSSLLFLCEVSAWLMVTSVLCALSAPGVLLPSTGARPGSGATVGSLICKSMALNQLRPISNPAAK